MTTEEIEKAARSANPYKVSESVGNCLSFNNGFKAGVEYATKYWQEKSVEMFNKQRHCVHEWQPLWDSNSSLTSVKHYCLNCGEIQ